MFFLSPYLYCVIKLLKIRLYNRPRVLLPTPVDKYERLVWLWISHQCHCLGENTLEVFEGLLLIMLIILIFLLIRPDNNGAMVSGDEVHRKLKQHVTIVCTSTLMVAFQDGSIHDMSPLKWGTITKLGCVPQAVTVRDAFGWTDVHRKSVKVKVNAGLSSLIAYCNKSPIYLFSAGFQWVKVVCRCRLGRRSHSSVLPGVRSSVLHHGQCLRRFGHSARDAVRLSLRDQRKQSRSRGRVGGAGNGRRVQVGTAARDPPLPAEGAQGGGDVHQGATIGRWVCDVQ